LANDETALTFLRTLALAENETATVKWPSRPLSERWPWATVIWTVPTLNAPPTFAAFQQNRDPALEAILACREHLPGF
jgi:hypothetical protein